MTDRNEDGPADLNPGPETPPPAAPARRGRAFLWAFAAVLLAFLLGAAAWPALAPRLAAWLPPSFLPLYVAGDAALARVPELAKRLDGLGARVARLESGASRPPADGAALDALGRRLEALESAAAESAGRSLGLAQKDAAGTRAAADTLARLARAGADNAALLDALEARLAKVEAAAGATGLVRVAVSLAFALADLRAALAGNGPFAEQVSRVDSLMRTDGVGMDSGRREDGGADGVTGAAEAALADLAALSATGVATPGDLARALPQLARDVLAAEAEGESPGWFGRTWARLASVVTVRRVGEVAGDDAEALLARAGARLAADDLAGAVTEVAALQGPGADAAAAWLETARARLRGDAALAALNSALAAAFARGPA